MGTIENLIDEAKRIVRVWDMAETEREEIEELFAQAAKTGDYRKADEMSADLNENQADLGGDAIEMLRRIVTTLEEER